VVDLVPVVASIDTPPQSVLEGGGVDTARITHVGKHITDQAFALEAAWLGLVSATVPSRSEYTIRSPYEDNTIRRCSHNVYASLG
jgi:hypothetical protein